MAGSVAQFKNRPEPNQSAGRAPAGAHRNDPAPKAECDESCIRDQEPEGKIVADEATHKTGGSEDLIQPGDVLLYRMCRLSNNQQQEHKLSFAFHKISLQVMLIPALPRSNYAVFFQDDTEPTLSRTFGRRANGLRSPLREVNTRRACALLKGSRPSSQKWGQTPKRRNKRRNRNSYQLSAISY